MPAHRRTQPATPTWRELNDGADINWVTRNVFVRCGTVFLRDGGIRARHSTRRSTVSSTHV